MGRNKLIDKPEMEFELPLKKTKDGNYIVIPKKKGYSGITIVNKKNSPNGDLYLIRAHGTSFYKFGVSNSPDRRLKDIDSYLPFDIDILSLRYFINVYDIEEHLSKVYEHKNIRREWYELTIDEAKDIMIYLHNYKVKNDGSSDRK